MCGIVGAISKTDVTPVLINGLKRLEYRGYDSAGIAVIDHNQIKRVRRQGKLNKLVSALKDTPHGGWVKGIPGSPESGRGPLAPSCDPGPRCSAQPA